MSKLEKKLINQMIQTIEKFKLISDNEKIILGLSGGQDSISLYHLFKQVNINFIPVHISYEWTDGTENQILPSDTIIIKSNIVNILKEESVKKNYCFVCSRLRRKLLIEYSNSIGITKIAFAHNKNDLAETLLLNIFFSKEISTLMPKQTLFNNSFEIIRPLYEVEDFFLTKYVKEKCFQILSNPCPYASFSKRQNIRNMLSGLQENVDIKRKKINLIDNIYDSLKRVNKNFLPFDV